MKRRMIRKISERGVTLAELMVTLTIIALLTGGIAFAISGFRDKAKKQDAENNTKSLYTAVEAWKNDHSGCPTVEQLKSDGIIGETSRRNTRASPTSPPAPARTARAPPSNIARQIRTPSGSRP